MAHKQYSFKLFLFRQKRQCSWSGVLPLLFVDPTAEKSIASNAVYNRPYSFAFFPRILPLDRVSFKIRAFLGPFWGNKESGNGLAYLNAKVPLLKLSFDRLSCAFAAVAQKCYWVWRLIAEGKGDEASSAGNGKAIDRSRPPK